MKEAPISTTGLAINPLSISIIIPTYQRGEILVNTIRNLLSLDVQADQIVIVDQTAQHENEIETQLQSWHSEGRIVLCKLNKPSVVAAMNTGLVRASGNYVLFLDDDIRIENELIADYRKRIGSGNYKLIAGRVIQPWDTAEGRFSGEHTGFCCNSPDEGWVSIFMGGNFLVDKSFACSIGGFDQNFLGAAHDFEREFADRVLQSGQKIFYDPACAIVHLKVSDGGIRAYGHFLKTVRPHFSMGAYYYILTSKRVKNKLPKILKRMFSRISTRTHLREPWWIPLTFIGDIGGLVWAMYLQIGGQKLLDDSRVSSGKTS